VSFRKDTELRVVRSLCASIADIFGENHHEMVAMSLLLEKSSSKPGEESAHPNTRKPSLLQGMLILQLRGM
jgi:hypothetical protein